MIEHPLPCLAIRVPFRFWRSGPTFHDNAQVESQPFGLGVTYDLGGGASVAADVVDPDRLGEDTRADIGVTFNF